MSTRVLAATTARALERTGLERLRRLATTFVVLTVLLAVFVIR